MEFFDFELSREQGGAGALQFILEIDLEINRPAVSNCLFFGSVLTAQFDSRPTAGHSVFSLTVELQPGFIRRQTVLNRDLASGDDWTVDPEVDRRCPTPGVLVSLPVAEILEMRLEPDAIGRLVYRRSRSRRYFWVSTFRLGRLGVSS